MQKRYRTYHSSPEATGQRFPVGTLTWQDIHQHLQRQRDAIINEIRHYPPPIPACDVQFNYLLEQRTQIMREIKRLGHIDPADQTGLEEFVATSSFLKDSQIRASSLANHLGN